MSKKHKRPNRQGQRPHRINHGAPPGALIGEEQGAGPQLWAMAFDEEGFEERELARLDEALPMKERWKVLWLHVGGEGHAGVLRQAGELFGVHRLALEDVLHVHQRPKIEEYEDNLFFVFRVLEKGLPVQSSQFCVFLQPGMVITFDTGLTKPAETLRERIRQGRGRIRSMGADFLAYRASGCRYRLLLSRA